DAGGIGLERDLGFGRDRPQPADLVEDAADGRRLHQRWRAAADEDAGDRAPADTLPRCAKLTLERGQKAWLVDAADAHVAVEIAVRALRCTERPVNVDPESNLVRIACRRGRHPRRG